MNAEIRPLLTLRQRLENTLKHDGLDLPREANTTVRVGDLREALRETDTWKDRAVAAGYTPEPDDFYVQVTVIQEGRAPIRLTARYAPDGFTDPRPYKVSQLTGITRRTVADFPTPKEAIECPVAIILRADKEV